MWSAVEAPFQRRVMRLVEKRKDASMGNVKLRAAEKRLEAIGIVAPRPPVNGIAATWWHDEGAIARCHYCRRYTLNPKALSDRPPACECGEKHGWSGSFARLTQTPSGADCCARSKPPNVEFSGGAPLYGAASAATQG